jgi:lipopolysaccharide transport system ATP-binding protein
MPDIVIKAEGLGKSYLIGHQGQRERYTALRDVLANQVRSVWGATRRALRGQAALNGQEIEEFWALRDVSFEVKQGEVVGIIGRNGAGKSTLLKILSRITEPTAGRVTLNGRVASLLEVGTGFHPELTGRENIFLNGAILGMTRAEIKRKFDEIVAFAEVERFLDTPVKRYSSGMHVRLGFAVAAHLEPEILVVDEVLAVGDADFQKKCLGKMGDVARGGRTILFVSHNMGAIQSLCQTALQLRCGSIVGRGPVADQLLAYQNDLQSNAEHGGNRRIGSDLQLDRMSASPSVITTGEAITISLAVRATCDTLISGLCILIHNLWDVRVAIVDLRRREGPYRLGTGQALSLQTTVRNLPLVEGEYALGLYVESAQSSINLLDICRVEVLPRPLNGRVSPYKTMYRGYLELTHALDDVRTN